MGNTCGVSAAPSAQELAIDAGHQQQRVSRIALVDGSAAIDTIVLDSESSTTAATTDEEGGTPFKRSKGRKGTAIVRKGDLDEEQLQEVQMQLPEEDVPEGESEALTQKKGEGDGDGDGSDAEDRDRKKVLINEGVNETFWLKGKDVEERRVKRTSHRKATPQDLDKIRQQAHFDEPGQEADAAAGADPATMPALLVVAPAPKRRGRKPTGCPTAQQVAEVVRQQKGDEDDEVQSPPSPAPPRQKVRRDTGHPTADSRRARARRVLGRLFGAA